mmetsp:Transcript_2369/g.3004  ORF Transcript_2369/g.3004 Transcript_2369/m.3004 type:complete len:96 (-) Transcript_2369:465-752(-)
MLVTKRDDEEEDFLFSGGRASPKDVSMNEVKKLMKDNKQISLQIFLKFTTEAFGEIESLRIEKLFTASTVNNFTFDTGVIGIDELYRQDLEEIVE